MADLKRIRNFLDAMIPSFPEALDKAFELMEKNQLLRGGDSHHGVMVSTHPSFDFNTFDCEWNRVRLPRLIHIEVHTLYAAAFVSTPWSMVFGQAHILYSAGGWYPTKIQRQNIVKRYKKGEFPKGIGKSYGVSGNTIRRVLTEEGVELRSNKLTSKSNKLTSKSNKVTSKWSPNNVVRQNIVRSYEKGKTLVLIGKSCGVSAPLIARILKEERIKLRTPSLIERMMTETQQQDIIYRREKGETLTRIAENYDLSFKVIRRFLKKKGVVLSFQEARQRREIYYIKMRERKAA